MGAAITGGRRWLGERPRREVLIRAPGEDEMEEG